MEKHIHFSETEKEERYNTVINIFKNKFKSFSIAEKGITEETKKTTIHIKGVFTIFISHSFVFFTISEYKLNKEQLDLFKDAKKNINLATIPTDDLQSILEKEAEKIVKYANLYK